MRLAPHPIRQSKGGQFVDAASLLALLFVTLFVSTFVFASHQQESAPPAPQTHSVAKPELSPAERHQFDQMKARGMVDESTVEELARTNAPSDHKYSIEWLPLIGMIALAAAYLAFVYFMSFREYREVITARFGPGDES